MVGRPGRLHRIDLVVPEGAEGQREMAVVRAVLPPGAVLEPAAVRSAFVEPATRAFRVNLAALSLLALVVGMFLIYNTGSFAVVRRRAVIGRRMLQAIRGLVLRLSHGALLARLRSQSRSVSSSLPPSVDVLGQAERREYQVADERGD